CLTGDVYYENFEDRFVGVDRDFGEVTVSKCKRCGQFWLHYLMEYEHRTAAGRWFRGPVSPKIAASVTAASATKLLEKLDWYFRGGSDSACPGFRRSGKLVLNFFRSHWRKLQVRDCVGHVHFEYHPADQLVARLALHRPARRRVGANFTYRNKNRGNLDLTLGRQ